MNCKERKKQYDFSCPLTHDLLWMSVRKKMWDTFCLKTNLEREQASNKFIAGIKIYVWDTLNLHEKEMLSIDIKRELDSSQTFAEIITPNSFDYELNEDVWKDLALWADEKLKEENDTDDAIDANEIPTAEWMFREMLLGAINYACNRQTIAAAMLPQEIIQHAYDCLSAQDKIDIMFNLHAALNLNNGCFGHAQIDNIGWQKFLSFLDEEHYQKVIGTDDKEYVVFEALDRTYPVERYKKEPWAEVFLPSENIKAIL